jgi:hypothetical protein
MGEIEERAMEDRWTGYGAIVLPHVGPRRNLLLASGRSRVKKLFLDGDSTWHGELITIDMNPDAGVDVVHDCSVRPLPFPDGHFHEIHAYDCLEHWGAQGDWRAWFDEMAEYHRLLVPGGELAAVVPVGADYYADPGHTRFIALNHFQFLNQAFYAEQERLQTSCTDYRWYWKLNFDCVAYHFEGDPAHHLGVILRKPFLKYEDLKK